MTLWLRALLGTLAIVALAQLSGLTDRLNRNITDAHWRAWVSHVARPFPTDILVVAIDDKSLQREGRVRYWSRKKYADLIDRLREAKAVGLDILFDEEDVVDRKGDAALAAAVRRHGKVVIPFHQWSEIPPITQASLEYRNRLMARLPETGAALAADTPLIQSSVIQPPIPSLVEAAAALGNADVAADPDGVYRAPVMVRQTETGKLIPHFALATAIVAEGQSAQQTFSAPSLRLGESTPNLIQGAVWLEPMARRAQRPRDWPGSPVDMMSFVDAMKAPLSVFKDRIVLVGETATGTTDIRATILDPGLRGIELNAEIVANLLFTEPVGEFPQWLSLLLLFVAIGVPILVYERAASAWAGAWSVIALMIPLGLMEIGFWTARLVPSWTPIILGSLSATGIMVAQRVAREEAQKRLFRIKFSQYVPPELVENLVSKPDVAVESGTRKRIVVLFSDVRSFTSYSEQNPPELVVRQMCEYLSEMTDSVYAHGGVLDKFIGDAVMALFGPIFVDEETNWSARAVACSLDMLARLDRLNQNWAGREMPSFRIGIGLHVGDAVVGSIGSALRHQFTALGDTVNLSARLQSETKALKATLIASEDVIREARPMLEGHARFIDRGELTVRGREEPVRVYEIVTAVEETVADENVAAETSSAPAVAPRRRNLTERNVVATTEDAAHETG